MDATTTTTRKALIDRIYTARRDRAVNPEGSFDKSGRWYPSATEDCSGDGSSTRTPSRAWPYSYLLRCRTRQHVAALVDAALRGEAVPCDVARAMPAPAQSAALLAEEQATADRKAVRSARAEARQIARLIEQLAAVA